MDLPPELEQRLPRGYGAGHHRQAVWLSGEAGWCRRLTRALLGQRRLQSGEIFWCGDDPPPGVQAIPPDRAHHHLGRECRALVIDAFAGLDPDALGALGGTLVGGGLFCLLTPPPEAWPHHPDPQRRRIAVAGWPESAVGGRYLARLARTLAADPHCLHLAQHAPPRLPEPAPCPAPPPPPEDRHCASRDQQAAVEALLKTALGARRHPTVLTADRGRGKSAALGIAAARLLQTGRRRILITAPRPEAARAVFRHADALLPGARCSNTHLLWREGEMRFIAVDALLRERPEADLILVDEAAALPGAILTAILAHWPRVAYATTVHGYEGSGRGFALRFQDHLRRHSRGRRLVHLRQPIRWAEGDPVEALIFRLLLLDAEAGPAAPPSAPLHVHPEDRDRLAADERRLSHLFGLLLEAHYRTRPSDLRHLLDGPNLQVFSAGEGTHPAACALLAREGGFSAHFAEAIWRGERRPHGHLLPESLAVHLGLAEAPRLQGARVVRLAVHPRLQRRGLGSAFLQALCRRAEATGLDYIGASFGADEGLLHFWRANGFLPLRLGLSRSAMSGEHSVLMMRPLSPAGRRLTEAARAVFAAQLPHALGDHLRSLEPQRVDALLGGLPPWPHHERRREIIAYAHHRRLLEAAMADLAPCAWRALNQPHLRTALAPFQRHALILRLLQKRPWDACAATLGLPGRRQVDALLRETFRRILELEADTPPEARLTRDHAPRDADDAR